ncbi:hypothetical protein [Enterovibrio coralii]|uniref:hypothetical protein n=1 Tax=Enterovibrio coralii TaxID=294935 RepID=UPI000B2131C7|nr:hypothetical protein [Enterovibrio coralii]
MGLYPVTITETGKTRFTQDTPSSLALLAVHQDQVLSPAPAFVTLAASDFCPQAITAKGTRILTMQCHPEFTAPFIVQLLERLREKAGNDTVDSAKRTVEHYGEGDRQRVVSLIHQFIRSTDKQS